MPQVTTDRQPPPGFEFIAAGNAVLSTKCKELSREQEALVFIVSVRHLRPSPPISLTLVEPLRNQKAWTSMTNLSAWVIISVSASWTRRARSSRQKAPRSPTGS